MKDFYQSICFIIFILIAMYEIYLERIQPILKNEKVSKLRYVYDLLKTLLVIYLSTNVMQDFLSIFKELTVIKAIAILVIGFIVMIVIEYFIDVYDKKNEELHEAGINDPVRGEFIMNTFRWLEAAFLAELIIKIISILLS